MISAADVPRLTEENLAAHLAHLARRYPGARVEDGPEVLLVDSGLCCETFNKVARARASGDAAALVARCTGHFAASGRPFAWWLGPESGLGVLDPFLCAAGLSPTEEETGMALRLDLLRAGEEIPAGLVLRRLQTVGDVRAFAAIIAATWEPPDAEVRRFYETVAPAMFDMSGPFRGWLALQDGEPVAAAEIFHTPGVAGVYSVCTLESFRRRGVASTLLHAALAHARTEGACLAVLQAAPGGLGVYRRLGFEETGRFEEWTVRP